MTSLGYPCKFQLVSRLSSVTAATSLTGSQPNFARCLAVSWAGTCTLYIHFRVIFPPNGILPGAKFPLRSSLALSYIASVNARHLSSGHQPNCSVEQRAPPVVGRATITLGIGPHSSFFLLLLLLLSFFSSPNLSGRRLDVYHTLAHGVALVRI